MVPDHAGTPASDLEFCVGQLPSPRPGPSQQPTQLSRGFFLYLAFSSPGSPCPRSPADSPVSSSGRGPPKYPEYWSGRGRDAISLYHHPGIDCSEWRSLFSSSPGHDYSFFPSPFFSFFLSLFPSFLPSFFLSFFLCLSFFHFFLSFRTWVDVFFLFFKALLRMLRTFFILLLQSPEAGFFFASLKFRVFFLN